LCDKDSASEVFLKNLHERLCIQMACKAAVKSGDELSHEKIYEILDNLEQIENRFTCPHGRPTMWVLHKRELEKNFRRDYTR
jgi:DNA mismatch repair protein MutL